MTTLQRLRAAERRLASLEKLRATLANFETYTWAEGDSWTDDQAEDAITTLNDMIRHARRLKPRRRPHVKVLAGKCNVCGHYGADCTGRPDRYEAAARAAGWEHGGDAGGFWFHRETWGSWKAAASWAGTDQEPEKCGAIYDTARELCDAEGVQP